MGYAQGTELQNGEMQLQGEVSIMTRVDSRLSYKGMLKKNGSPVTGSRDMLFRLYSDSSCSAQVGSDIAQSSVQVADGLFSVELNVTHSEFNGQGLWLEVESGGTNIGCQEILSVPYASDGSVNVSLNRTWPYVPTGKYGVYAEAEGTDSFTYYGVYGSGSDYGVYGHSDSGAAIYGKGDVMQNRTGNGLVKAAVHTYCGYCLSCKPERSFNNVDNDIDCICGASAGRCTLNFGFDIGGRYWVAMAVGETDYGVTCHRSSDFKLECSRWQAGTGQGTDGYIMVLVY